jgi:hypothetical protein
MKQGFGKDKTKLKTIIDGNELNNLIKEYKKLKKYKKSSLYTIKTLDGNEKVISSLLKNYGEDL